MNRRIAPAMVLMVTFVCWMGVAAANPIASSESSLSRTESSEPFLLGPPKEAGPVVVRARFELHDLNEIYDGLETFEFTGASPSSGMTHARPSTPRLRE